MRPSMKKVKISEVPLPGAKTAPKPTAKATKQLSSEFIHDSDDSGVDDPIPTKSKASSKEKSKSKSKEKSAEKSKDKSKQKSPVQIAVHRPKQNGVKSNPKPTPVKPAPAPAPPKATPVPLPVTNGREAARSSSSDEETDGGEEEGIDFPEEEEKGKGSDETSASSSESEESEDEDMTDAPAPQTTVNPAAASQSHTVQLRPPPPFEPPKGFNAVTSYKTSSEAVKMLGNVKGKQIWHITAPAGVPVERVQEVALEQISNGEAVLTHKNIDYGFFAGEANETASLQVMVPGPEGYIAVPSRISKSLHLQEVVRLPIVAPIDDYVDTAAIIPRSIVATSGRPPRPQPKGLRMRYFHSGFGERDPGILGSSDDEAEAAAIPANNTSKKSHNVKKAEKRKHEADTEPSSSKKHRKDRDPDEAKRRREKKEKKRLKELAKAQ